MNGEAPRIPENYPYDARTKEKVSAFFGEIIAGMRESDKYSVQDAEQGLSRVSGNKISHEELLDISLRIDNEVARENLRLASPDEIQLNN